MGLGSVCPATETWQPVEVATPLARSSPLSTSFHPLRFDPDIFDSFFSPGQCQCPPSHFARPIKVDTIRLPFVSVRRSLALETILSVVCECSAWLQSFCLREAYASVSE